MKSRCITVILVLVLCASEAFSATKYPAETRNAALRYWMAFAEMHDTSLDKPTQELLEKTAAAESPWDEARLGAVLDANEDAIRMMQRATTLPDCDWGLEYSRGPEASIAYAPRARALARLNTLQGMRELARGDSEAAVQTWLAGIHFSRDLARGGTLIFALMAKSVLLPDLRLLDQAARDGRLSESKKKDIFLRISSMPEDGFDWGSAWAMETIATDQTLQRIKNASNPGAEYELLMGKPVPKQGLPPSAEDMQTFHEYMSAVEAALRESPDRAGRLLDALQNKRNAFNEVEQGITPKPQKVNAARKEVAIARAELLRVVK